MVAAFVDPVVVASQDMVILEVNDAMLKLFGYSDRGGVVGKNVKMLMPQSVAAVRFACACCVCVGRRSLATAESRQLCQGLF